MGWCSVVRNTMRSKKIRHGYILSSIIRIQNFNGMIKVFLYDGSKPYEDLFDIIFVFEWIKPNIPCIMVHKNDIILVTINRENWRCPYIRIYDFKRMR